MQKTAELALSYELNLMPTFFCGHMSGINWLPTWMLAPSAARQRFPVYSNKQLHWRNIRNCYTDQEVIAAQTLQIQQVTSALKGHSAIFAYDLGNETSNWVMPPQRSDAQKWLAIMTKQIKDCSGGAMVTLGMHAEDLEEDRRLWPQDAASYCDFLCMHGYPFYLSWVEKPMDPDLVPFLGIITAWLGGKPVLFQEFGLPTRSVLPPLLPSDYESTCLCPLWTEDEAAAYYYEVLPALDEVGMIGGMAWCYADYAPSLWERLPLNNILHERHFGMFRHDGSAKPAAEVFRHYRNASIDNSHDVIQVKFPWLYGTDRDKFYQHPKNNLSRLYQRYKEHLKGQEI